MGTVGTVSNSVSLKTGRVLLSTHQVIHFDAPLTSAHCMYRAASYFEVKYKKAD